MSGCLKILLNKDGSCTKKGDLYGVIFRIIAHLDVHAICMLVNLMRNLFVCSIQDLVRINPFSLDLMVRSLYNLTIIASLNVKGGEITELEFIMGANTDVYHSCSATLNGEMFLFGGYES